jgi:hypothetical protein
MKVKVTGIYYGSHKRYGIDEPEPSANGRREEVLLEESRGDWPYHLWDQLARSAFLTYDEEMRNSGTVCPTIRISDGIKTEWWSARQLRELGNG